MNNYGVEQLFSVPETLTIYYWDHFYFPVLPNTL